MRAKARVKKTKENPKENTKENKHKSKTSKTGLPGLENLKSETSSDTQESAQKCPTDTSWNDGWNCDEWNDGWSFDEWNDDGTRVGNKRMTLPQAHFHLEVWMSVPTVVRSGLNV